MSSIQLSNPAVPGRTAFNAPLPAITSLIPAVMAIWSAGAYLSGMAHLPIDPSAPWYVRNAIDSILVLHIGGGSIGLLSGTTALIARKGEWLHRTAGNVFFASMLAMAGVGATVAPLLPRPEWTSSVVGLLTLYLVASAWMTVRRKEGEIGRFELAALAVPLAVVAADAMFIIGAARSPTGTVDGAPVPAFYAFGIVGAIAALSDIKVILARGITGVQRIARHLWRMCTALFVASGSLFLGQPQVFPASIRHSGILFVPALAPLVFLIFWMIRVRIGERFKRGVGTLDPAKSPPHFASPMNAG